MSFHVSAWSIKNPVPTLVLFLVLGIIGVMSFLQLGINDNPNIDVPAVQVIVTQPGAGPSELETQITQPVEDAVAGLGNIDKITSIVNEGNSTTTIEFILGSDTDRATNDVRNAISQIQSELPPDANDPIVQRLEFAGGAIMTYAVSSESRTVEELSDLVDRTIGRAILAVPGVAQIDRLGGLDREIRVDLDPGRLQSLRVTATEVNDQIRNFNINLPGGRTEVGGSEQNVRTLGSQQSVAELQSYPIVLSGGGTVPLSSLGDIRDGTGEARKSAFLNNEQVVGFSVLRSTGSNLATVEEQVREVVDNIRETLDDDIELQLVFTRADSVRDSFRATTDALIFGSILTIITVGIFLRDWRATLITALALPLSIIPTFWVMGILDYTLNGMTLLALALAIGNLVDDAICMIENIDQHLDMGKKPYRAALDASREIGISVVTTTATIVAVFLPVAFMGGIPGQFFQPFGVTVAVSTMFSTLVATTMTPMLSAYILKGKHKPNENNGNGHKPGQKTLKTAPLKTKQPRRPYRSLLTWGLRHRITTLLIAIAFFVGSLQLIPLIPQGLFDSGDTGLSTLSVELPPGSTLEDTEEVLFSATNLLLNNPAVDTVLASASAVNSASVYINLVPKEDRISQQEFEETLRTEFAKIPGTEISFGSQGAGGGGKDLSLIIQSDDAQTLAQTAEDIEMQMRDMPGLVEVSSSASLVRPELVIEPDPDRATDLGVSVNAIARTASLALIGDNESNLAKFNLPDRQIPILVQLDPAARGNISTLQNLEIPSQNGTLVPLNAVADIRLGSGPATIQRLNRSRQISLEANLQGISLGDALESVRNLPAMNPLPPGVSEEPAGDAEIMRDIFARFASALGLSILSIYVILVLLYNNFLYPLTILAALPLSIGGALIALLITQKELGLFALIGIVLLMGLVTKNAILLVDFALDNQRQGLPQFKAIVEAGVSRFRPIVMTSISTIAGMIPIALELGADGEVRSPMAIAVIGGFSTSTLLTLVVVPVIFTYIDNITHWLKKLLNVDNEEKETVRPVELEQSER